MPEGWECRVDGDKGEKTEWDYCNSIINKIYLKIKLKINKEKNKEML